MQKSYSVYLPHSLFFHLCCWSILLNGHRYNKGMKQTRKIGSLLIRQPSKRSSREEANKTKTSLHNDPDKKRNTLPKFDSNFELQKEFVRAENLSEEQQARIRKQAERTVGKKAKSTEIKIQNDLISMLEQECNKLGVDLERERAENQKLRFQIGELRKNIDFLSSKLENINRDKEYLARNNDYGKMEKDQLKEQLQKLRTALQTAEGQRDYQRNTYASQTAAFQTEISELRQRNVQLQADLKAVREEKEEVEEELEEKSKQYEYVRENFEQRKREWDRIRQELESQTKENLEKKGEKITKYQVQTQGLAEKLKEEEGLRKKLLEKNKELEKEVGKRSDTIRDLQQQIQSLKKRINDLSILKSSNNTIMNQKLAQLQEENAKLKKDNDILQAKKGALVQQESLKPYLFGPDDQN